MQTVCPSWFAFSLNNRLRRLLQEPEKILNPFIKPGYVCGDIGCGPGFFTVAMARMCAPGGRVIAVDLQPEMLDKVRENAEQSGVIESVTVHQCRADDLLIPEKLDFALAFWMVHEVPKAQRPAFFRQLYAAMKKGGCLLVTDPGVPWLGADFRRSLECARQAGFELLNQPSVTWSRTALLRA